MRSISHFPTLSLALVFVSFVGLACHDAKNESPVSHSALNKESVFDKLIGTWQNHNDKSFERWTRQPDGTYISVVYTLTSTDTSWNERAKIYDENGHWVFENAVRDQNNGHSVKFISSLLTDSCVQFSNPAHDFPTDINYTIINSNSVHAFIIGPNSNGAKDTIVFNYTKVN